MRPFLTFYRSTVTVAIVVETRLVENPGPATTFLPECRARLYGRSSWTLRFPSILCGALEGCVIAELHCRLHCRLHCSSMVLHGDLIQIFHSLRCNRVQRRHRRRQSRSRVSQNFIHRVPDKVVTMPLISPGGSIVPS